MSKAIIDIASIATAEELKQALTIAGLEDAGDQAASVLAFFRSTDAPSVPGARPRGVQEVGIWVGSRTDRSHNPFRRGVYHVLGGYPSIDPEVVRSTMEKLYQGGFLHPEDLLESNSTLERHQASHSDDKAELTRRLEAFCQRIDLQDYILDHLVECLDELFTNALYDAPVAAGLDGAVQKSRGEATSLPLPATVAFGFDDKHVLLSVADAFGALVADTLLDSLARCYEDSRATVLHREGGAGIGFFKVLQNGCRVVANLSQGMFTEIVVLRQRQQKRRAFSRSAPTLNICVSDL